MLSSSISRFIFDMKELSAEKKKGEREREREMCGSGFSLERILENSVFFDILSQKKVKLVTIAASAREKEGVLVLIVRFFC